MPHYVKVAETGELASGERKVVEAEGVFIAVFNVDGQFYAIEDVCTHDDGPLGDGELDGYVVQCPRHGAKFDIRSGAVLSFPAIKPVPFYPTKIEGGDVLADIEEA